MGTHSLIRFREKKDKPMCAIYQQFDGYPSGVGAGLAEFLVLRKMCNGIAIGEQPSAPATTWANGLGCLVAQYIAATKKGPGGLYVEDIDAPEEEWTYEVITDGEDDAKLRVEVKSPVSEVVFTGTPQEFKEWAVAYKYS